MPSTSRLNVDEFRPDLVRTRSGRLFKDVDHIVSSQGSPLFSMYWRPEEEEPRGLVFIIHGFREYCTDCRYRGI